MTRGQAHCEFAAKESALMGQELCSYCGGSGRNAIIPTKSFYRCNGSGTDPDPVRVDISDPPSSPGSTAARRRASQYQMLPWMERIFDSIPRWLNLLFAVIGSGAGITLAHSMGSTLQASMALFAVGGFLVGFVFLRLLIVLVDLTFQFTVGLVKLAIVLAIFGVILYAVLKWIGAI